MTPPQAGMDRAWVGRWYWSSYDLKHVDQLNCSYISKTRIISIASKPIKVVVVVIVVFVKKNWVQKIFDQKKRGRIFFVEGGGWRNRYKQKCHKLWKKSIIFLTPPPRIMWTILNLGKYWYLMTPQPKIGKNLKCRHFWDRCTPLALAKTVLKSYLIVTLRLIQLFSYISQICTKCCPYLTNISPIYNQNLGHISVI